MRQARATFCPWQPSLHRHGPRRLRYGITGPSALNFTSDFLVGQGGLVALGSYVVLSLGWRSFALATAAACRLESMPAPSPMSLSFSTCRRTASPASLSSRLPLRLVSRNSRSSRPTPCWRRSPRSPGQTLQGDQEVAQLNYASQPGQTSAFVPLSPLSLQAISAAIAGAEPLAASPGRLVISESPAVARKSL